MGAQDYKTRHARPAPVVLVEPFVAFKGKPLKELTGASILSARPQPNAAPRCGSAAAATSSLCKIDGKGQVDVPANGRGRSKTIHTNRTALIALLKSTTASLYISAQRLAVATCGAGEHVDVKPGMPCRWSKCR